MEAVSSGASENKKNFVNYVYFPCPAFLFFCFSVVFSLVLVHK